MLAGDFFLARYAGNFFAKAFIPQRRAHLQGAANLDIQPSRVCIHCWHSQRQLIVESEGHVFFECPRYTAARTLFIDEVAETTQAQLLAANDSLKKLIVTLGSFSSQDWEAFGRFAGRVRQMRRRMRQQFEAMSNKLAKTPYAQKNKKIEWRSRGRFVCRHGVFFNESLDCPCLSARRSDPGAWSFARKMPYLCHELKASWRSSWAPTRGLAFSSPELDAWIIENCRQEVNVLMFNSGLVVDLVMDSLLSDHQRCIVDLRITFTCSRFRPFRKSDPFWVQLILYYSYYQY